jgi:hypothetical protein
MALVVRHRVRGKYACRGVGMAIYAYTTRIVVIEKAARQAAFSVSCKVSKR